MKLWGGDSDSGCCSVERRRRRPSRRPAARHRSPRVQLRRRLRRGTSSSRTCVPTAGRHARTRASSATGTSSSIGCCERADQLGFDAVATGHHARDRARRRRRCTLERGADAAKDQSYVVHMLDQRALARTLFPVGHIDKSEVRRHRRRARPAHRAKPDSQDVCFITSTGGRETFLGDRIAFRRGRVVDTDGRRGRVRRRGRDWSRSASGAASACRAAARSATSSTSTSSGRPSSSATTPTCSCESPIVGRRRPGPTGRSHGDGARPVQRARRAPRRPRWSTTATGAARLAGDAAAPHRARPERRVLRPRRPSACSAAASPR